MDFEPISLEKQYLYRTYLQRCPQNTSDYSFVNLWAWSQAFGLSWAFDRDLVWLRQTLPRERYWAPIGAWEQVDWNRYADRMSSESIRFIRIPDRLVEIWRKAHVDRMVVEEDKGQWDYLYAVDELIRLEGKRFHKKKNLFNQFIRNYTYTYTGLTEADISLALSLQSDWCQWRDCESYQSLSAENRAIERVFTNWSHLDGIMGGMILVNRRIAAYTVAEKLTEEMLLIHFEKADPDFKGAYQAINQMFLAETKTGCIRVNREQDLDDEGLRRAKQSYHPVDFLHKYKVTFG